MLYLLVLFFQTFCSAQIYENRYGLYRVPADHNRPAANLIRNGKVYEQRTLHLIEKLYPKGTSIVHAGTYFGDMLPFFSKLVGEKTVWAFEPVKLNYEYAASNVDLNQLSNVRLHNLALSNSITELYMETVNQNGKPRGGGSMIVENFSDKNEKVSTSTIDSIVGESEDVIGVIQLDVEGHEIEALEGASRTIDKFQPLIVLECWKGRETELDTFMKSKGYKKLTNVDGNSVYHTG